MEGLDEQREKVGITGGRPLQQFTVWTLYSEDLGNTSRPGQVCVWGGFREKTMMNESIRLGN
jgi:hypothetical protein